jgi:ligand-binding sensor domain-containing protein
MVIKRWFKAVLILSLLLRLSSSIAQSLPFKHYTTLEGLPSQTVYEALQDRKGFMWFATSAGVSRFDGYRFINYTVEDGLPDNEIFGLHQDVFDRIWLRSMNGKIAYILHNKIFNSQNTPSLKDLDKSSPVLKITSTKDSSVLIAYYSDGVTKYTSKNKALNVYTPSAKDIGSYIGAYEDKNESYLMIKSCALQKLSSRNEVTIIPFNFTTSKNEFINNEYYVASEDKFSVMNKKNEFTSWVKTGSTVLNICRGDNNSIWICTQKGAMNFDAGSKTPKKNYFNKNDISFVLHDNENNIWFTTLSNGIILLTNENIKNYTINDGLSSDKVFSIVKDDQGNVIIGHDNFTLSKINKRGEVSSIRILSHPPDLFKISNPTIYDINIEKSEMMIMTPQGLLYRDDKNMAIVTALRGRAIVQYHDDLYLVAGRYNGLRSFSKKLVKKYSLNHAKAQLSYYREIYDKFNITQVYPATSFANCIYQQGEGRFWIGMDSGLISLTKDGIVKVDDKYPVLKERIVDIKGDAKETLFIATSNKGVAILKKEGTIIRISKEQGLSSNQCTKIFIDGSTLWVGTTTGVNRVTVDENYQVNKIHIVNDSNGLLSNHVNTLLVNDEKVWIGTSSGLSIISKNLDRAKQRTPLLYLTGISANNISIDTLLKKKFHYMENNLKINYVGLSYKKGDINYKYRLVRKNNFTDDEHSPWQETKNTAVVFSLLPPGSYCFSVMAQSTKHGVWSEPIDYSFVINAPFWKTSGFVFLIAVTFTFIIILLWKYSQKISERKNIVKRKLQLAELSSLHSQMNYHFMSNAFNSLQGLFLSKKNIDQYIGKFSRLMRLTLEHSDRQLITLSEELEYLKLYCDIEKLRAGNQFTFNIELDEGMDVSKLQVPSLTLQPFVENAIWHGLRPKGGVGSVTLKILPHDSFSYTIIIEDDGIGINTSLCTKPKTKRKSYGTKLIIDRFEVIKKQNKGNFSLQIEDKSDVTLTSGTRVSITFPYRFEYEYDSTNRR